MIIYTDKNKAPNNLKFITNVDSYFCEHLDTFSFDDVDYAYIKEIEHLIDYIKESNICVNKFGCFDIKNISTGTKTLLIIRQIAKQKVCNVGIDVTGCGPNVLEYIFDIASDAKIPLILRHTDILGMRNREITIDDEVTVRKARNFCYALMPRLR